MSNWSSWRFTNIGKALQLRAEAGEPLLFTQLVLGDGAAVSTEEYAELLSLKSPVMTTPISTVAVEDDNWCKITAVVTNRDLEQATYIREMGLLAHDSESGNDVLFAVSIDDAPDCMPAKGRIGPITKGFEFYIVISETANVTAVIDPAGLITARDYQTALERVLTKEEEILRDAKAEYIAELERRAAELKQLEGIANAGTYQLTVAAEDWTENDEEGTAEAYPFRIDVDSEEITPDMIPTLAIHPASVETAAACDLCPSCKPMSGAIRFYAKSAPETDITAFLSVLASGDTTNGNNIGGVFVSGGVSKAENAERTALLALGAANDASSAAENNAAAIAANTAAIEENRAAIEASRQNCGYSQITKLNVAQMRTLEIPTTEDASFIRPPVEVLKLRDDGISETVTACSFNNGDSSDFSENDFVVFSGGVMQPRTRYEVNMTEPVVLGAGYMSASVPIDPAIYKTVTGVDVV